MQALEGMAHKSGLQGALHYFDLCHAEAVSSFWAGGGGGGGGWPQVSHSTDYFPMSNFKILSGYISSSMHHNDLFVSATVSQQIFGPLKFRPPRAKPISAASNSRPVLLPSCCLYALSHRTLQNKISHHNEFSAKHGQKIAENKYSPKICSLAVQSYSYVFL